MLVIMLEQRVVGVVGLELQAAGAECLSGLPEVLHVTFGQPR
jgi:hypothetical protein